MVAGDIAANYCAAGTGYGVWYINSALAIVVFLVLGWRWFPLPFLVIIVGTLIQPAYRFGDLGTNMLAEIPYAGFYVAATVFASGPLRVRFPLRTTRDVSMFAIVLCALAPLLANATSLVVYLLVDPHLSPWSQFLTLTLRGTAADATSNVVFVPAIMQLLAWRAPLGTGPELGVKIDRTFALGLGATVAVVVADEILGARTGYNFTEFAMLPLAYLAVQFGMRGAVLGVLAANITATIAQAVLHVSVNEQLEYQGFLVATTLLAYLLGAFRIERESLINRLQRVAYYDLLTALPNAGYLLEFLQKARGPVTLAIADISDLRLLNEGIGRDAVDSLMVALANRLREGLENAAFIARVGSGEFAVACVRDDGPAALASAIQRLTAMPFPIGDSQVFVEVSVGATASHAGQRPDELLRQAELAVRRAKESSHHTVIYEPCVESSAPPLLYAELHHAAERGEFVPFFQPIYRSYRGNWELAGAELLMRWRHPDRGVLAPSEFIHLLERLSISTRVGWELLEQGLHSATQWREIVPDFSLWVNFFPRQVLDRDCAQHIRSALATCGAPPEMLVVEITERVVAADELAFTRLARELRAMEVNTAIDDFGIGSSSLARVREVPAHVLKIDRSFVNRSDVDYKAMTVATTIVRLAAELDLKVVAEGIENQAQAKAMLNVGCDFGQGYALGHPVPAGDFARALPRVRPNMINQ
jgi:diguanylate cyclase (GGDEF)-like protein